MSTNCSQFVLRVFLTKVFKTTTTPPPPPPAAAAAAVARVLVPQARENEVIKEKENLGMKSKKKQTEKQREEREKKGEKKGEKRRGKRRMSSTLHIN